MHSPFPGMDPYLEEPSLWPDVHHGLISEIQATLNRLLRPRYHIRVEERVYISDEQDPGRKVIVPDLKVVDTSADVSRRIGDSSGIVAGDVDVAEPLVMTTLIEDDIREARLEVIDNKQQSVVTVIELLSPTNKILGARGRASYEEKRRETSSSHFVEIDLLRSGEHLQTRELLPAAEYFVHVSRNGLRPKGYVWPIRLPQRLPTIGIPLKECDADVPLDLQSVLASAYDRAAYDLQVDYRFDATPPIPAEYALWANELLVRQGLREA